MKTERILLAGATGYLGRYIAKELKKREYPTTVLLRKKNLSLDEFSYYKTAVAELTEPGSLAGIMDGIDTVISTVGITKQKEGFTYMDVDYQGNMNLLKEAEKAGVRKFIYVSGFMANKLTKLKICNAKESFVNELKNSKLDYCVIRPNGFFSDMSEFLKMARKGKAELFGNGNFRMNPIHGADLAEVCVHAIESDEKNIEVGGPEVLSHNEIAELAFKSVGKEVKVSYMSEWLRKTILWFARTFSSSKKYGPIEFFFTVLSMDMIAPVYGSRTLSEYYREAVQEK